MPDTYRYRGAGTVEIACGEMLAAGETTDRVNPKDQHDKKLIDAGLLAKTGSGRKRSQPASQTTTEEAGQ